MHKEQMYIYVAHEVRDDGTPVYPDVYKIGYTKDKSRRESQFKREQWAINPTFICALVIDDIPHNKPDTIIHKFLDNFLRNAAKRIDPHKELYHIEDFNVIHDLFGLLASYDKNTQYIVYDRKMHLYVPPTHTQSSLTEDEIVFRHISSDIIFNWMKPRKLVI